MPPDSHGARALPAATRGPFPSEFEASRRPGSAACRPRGIRLRRLRRIVCRARILLCIRPARARSRRIGWAQELLLSEVVRLRSRWTTWIRPASKPSRTSAGRSSNGARASCRWPSTSARAVACPSGVSVTSVARRSEGCASRVTTPVDTKPSTGVVIVRSATYPRHAQGVQRRRPRVRCSRRGGGSACAQRRLCRSGHSR